MPAISKKAAPAAAPPVAAPVAAPPPMLSIGRQKAYIVENAFALSQEAKITILTLIMMTTGASYNTIEGGGPETERCVLLTTNIPDSLSFDLNAIADYEPSLITQIYNIVEFRRRALDSSARQH